MIPKDIINHYVYDMNLFVCLSSFLNNYSTLFYFHIFYLQFPNMLTFNTSDLNLRNRSS